MDTEPSVNLSKRIEMHHPLEERVERVETDAAPRGPSPLHAAASPELQIGCRDRRGQATDTAVGPEEDGVISGSRPIARGRGRQTGQNPDEPDQFEVSIVMPCLDEADTLATCIEKAKRALDEHQINGEIVIADNGSTDGSQEIARNLGVRVVSVSAKGYGNALMGGIAAARGKYIIMGDADDSYDFLEIPKFVAKLREGVDLVQGCRLPSGGGTVKPGAMPWLHRWVGSPLLTLLVRHMFSAPINDVYCGLRGFTKQLYDRLDLRCTGMEFAFEMITKSSVFGVKIAEVPITLHPDGRKAHAPHLRTIRDGWRTLRFSLLYSPRWLFLYPGLLLIVLGLIGYGVAIPGLTLFGLKFDVHTLLCASLFIFVGFQSVVFAILAKTFAIGEGLLPEDPRIMRFYQLVPLETGLMIGTVALLAGGVLLLQSLSQWWAAGFGPLDYARTMRWVIPGVTLFNLGFQTIMSSFFASILGMRRR
jgi:glycosyltransferase involved in cell wall biosynthesis